MLSDEERGMPPGSPDGYKEFGVAVTRLGADAIADIVAGRPGGEHAMTDDELARLRDHATSNPSHAGDAVLRLVAEVERLRAREAGRVAACGAILGRLRGRKGTSEEGRLSLSDKIGLMTIAGRWRTNAEDAGSGAEARGMDPAKDI